MGITTPVAAALLAVYIFWGGTYLAMKFAIETLPPFTMAGLRFVIAGAIMYVWQVAQGGERPQAIHWKNAAIVGGLLLLGGNGGVVWAEQLVSSGIAAIIVATVPLWMALLSWLWQGGKRPGSMVLFGLVLGLVGIILLVKGSGGEAADTAEMWFGYAILLFAAISWAAGSLYSRVAKLPSAPFMSIALQMLTGGLCCLLAGLVTGEWTSLDFSQVSTRSLLSVGYLIFFGSIIAFSAYIWLLKKADPTLVSTYAYVNPVVAVLLGWAFAGEQMSLQSALAATIILAAVIIITKASTRKP
ncbi:drug/metabolite exporter YedA [Sporomusa malonica]|uniref:Permease of the drug/metabolite transporter (DMT) superfamily n=1 Tax=Sporomusa malonica TaxID=112901 RepID=A0A1W1YBB4_9FIRM|nr:drug/metabolite exporter YedA [Sporomusa malonica]SMC33439.1 Permease of the drug/metabolite transporter (DMT) superfamily [Sporomusa malonica]